MKMIFIGKGDLIYIERSLRTELLLKAIDSVVWRLHE